MKKFLLLIISVIFISTNVFGYEIIGKVIDERYFPVPNIGVTISGGAYTKTDQRGKFIINTEQLTYDIYLYDYAGMIGVFYNRLSSYTPELMMFGLSASRNINSEFLKVEFTPLTNSKTAIIKFLSEDIFSSEDAQANIGEKNKMLNINFPAYMDRINGRVIYLEKTPTEYTKYSEIPITINKDWYPQTIIFDNKTFSKDPKEGYVTIYPPAFAYDSKGFTVYADFLSQHRNAEMNLNTTEGDLVSIRVLVPLELSYGYRLKIEGRGSFKRGDSFTNYTYSYPGSSLNISTETPPSLDAPQDKYWGVSDNTTFSWDRGSGTGIFVSHFHGFNPVGDFYFVSAEKDVRFPKNIAGGILEGNEYSWEVKKYLTYTSVNDFTRPKTFVNDLGYKAVLTSELRTFRINPF